MGHVSLDALGQLGERLVTEGERPRRPVDRLITWRPDTPERSGQQPSVIDLHVASGEAADHLEDGSEGREGPDKGVQRLAGRDPNM
jgi:hypothetical protein